MNTLDLAKKIRLSALNMTSLGKSSHIGSVFSIADILAVLYGDVLHVNSKNPKMESRDRFILSKGHAGAGVYATLAHCGFFSEDVLKTHYAEGSILSGHVSHKGVPGVDFSTGSLGHGLSVGTGISHAALKKKEAFCTYVLMGDGECDEGAVWEAAMYAAHFKLDNLVGIIDYNKMQSLDTVENTIGLEPLEDKWRAFGWEVIRVDGHCHESLKIAFSSLKEKIGKPKIIIADTIKGKGVSFMENSVLWHYRNAQGDEYTAALAELSKM